MQRIFTTFPNSWPGAGLLLIRLALATALVMQSLPLNGTAPGIFLKSLAIVAALMLLVGVWTPIICLLQFIANVGLMTAGSTTFAQWGPLTALFLSLAMLGPGAWSLDARLFGRKRMFIEPE